MKFWEKLKQTDDVWKKVFIFCLLAVLAVPFLYLVGRNLNGKLNSASKEKFYQILKLDKLRQAKENVSSQIEEQEKNLTKAFQDLQELATSTTTSSPQANLENATTTN